MREEQRLRVLEKSVLRKTLRPKKDKVTGEWRKLHDEELHDTYKYSSPNIIRVSKGRRMKWAGHVARIGGGRGEYKALMGRHDEKRPPGRPRHRWEDNAKMDLQEVGWGGMDWIDLAQNRDKWQAVVNAGMNLWVP
jgi:hypothetical protein